MSLDSKPADLKPSSHLRILALSLVAAAALIVGTLPATAQAPDQQPEQLSSASITPTDTSNAASSYTIDQILPLTVAEAWQMSGKSEAKFFDIVQQLAAFSAEKRGLTLPDTAAAGKRAGEYIKAQAKADHDQLLYAIVDRAVRHVGTKAVAANP